MGWCLGTGCCLLVVGFWVTDRQTNTQPQTNMDTVRTSATKVELVMIDTSTDCLSACLFPERLLDAPELAEELVGLLPEGMSPRQMLLKICKTDPYEGYDSTRELNARLAKKKRLHDAAVETLEKAKKRRDDVHATCMETVRKRHADGDGDDCEVFSPVVDATNGVHKAENRAAFAKKEVANVENTVKTTLTTEGINGALSKLEEFAKARGGEWFFERSGEHDEPIVPEGGCVTLICKVSYGV